MEENKQEDIFQMIQGLSQEEQEKLLQSLLKNKSQENRKKVRRKHYQKEEKQLPKPIKKKVVRNKEYTNEFEKDPLFHANKQDVELDKKLWDNHTPTERNRPSSLVNATCKKCGKNEVVSKTLLVRSTDEDGRLGEPTYYCNRCVTNRTTR